MKRPCDSCPMSIVLLPNKITELLEKVSKQWSWVNLLMGIRLKGESRTYRTKVRGKKGRKQIKLMPLAIFWESSAKVMMGKEEIKVREEKRFLLPKIWLEAPKSRIQDPDKCVRREKTWLVWATNAVDVDLATWVRHRYFSYSLGIIILEVWMSSQRQSSNSGLKLWRISWLS